jgi:hypothetical protein
MENYEAIENLYAAVVEVEARGINVRACKRLRQEFGWDKKWNEDDVRVKSVELGDHIPGDTL